MYGGGGGAGEGMGGGRGRGRGGLNTLVLEAERAPRRPAAAPLDEYLTTIRTCWEITKPGINSGCRSLYRSRSASDMCPACCCRNAALPAAASCSGRGTFHNFTEFYNSESSRASLAPRLETGSSFLFALYLFIYSLSLSLSLLYFSSRDVPRIYT